MTEQVYVSPGLQTELLPVMSVSFRVNFDSVHLWVKRNLLCLGSRGGRLRKMRAAAHSRKRLWEIHLLQAKRVSLLRCTWGDASQGALSWGSRPLDALGKASKQGQKGGRGAKALSIAEPLQRTTKVFVVVAVDGLGFFYSLVLLLSILANSLILYNRFSFIQQMDLQALPELRRGDSFLGASTLVQVVLSMQAVSYFPFK